eukprot:6179050-Pleurochrysis_carterae.AAC.1
MREFDDLCRYMAERNLSKYVSSTLANSCELIVAIELYLEPDDFVADSDGSSDSTFSDVHAGPSVEIPGQVPKSADAEPLEEEGASSTPSRVRWASAVDEYKE